MKAALAIGMIGIGLVVFVAIYPSMKVVIDGADTTNFGAILSVMMSNMWWIAIVLGLVAVGSAWWILKD